MIRRTFFHILAGWAAAWLGPKRTDPIVIPRTTVQEWMEETCRTEGRKVYFSVELSERGTVLYRRCHF